jgi:hypothetical protein
VSYRIPANRWLGSAVACLAIVFAISRCGADRRSIARRADRRGDAGLADPAPRAVRTRDTGVATAAPAAATREAAGPIVAASASFTVPVAGPAGAPGRAPHLSPEVEGRRQLALLDWAHRAERALHGCLNSRPDARRATALEVSFFPEPRAAGEPRQLLTATRIALPPGEPARLAIETSPGELEACLRRLQDLRLSVSVGDAPSPGFPSSTEHVVVEL